MPSREQMPTTVLDVVVVGGGVAALTAATVAGRAGASVVVVEAAATLGGTAVKSAGAFWVPSNRLMRDRAIADPRFADDRDRALAHMARCSYPERYDRGAERHGLEEHEWNLIVSYYDHAHEALEDLEASGDISYMALGSFRGDDLGLIGAYETEEDSDTYGRVLTVTPVDGDLATNADALAHLAPPSMKSHDAHAARVSPFGDGVDLVRHLTTAAAKYGATFLVGHRVVDVLTDDDAVVGVVAETSTGPVRLHARRGVVFGSGGIEHNPELRSRFLRGPIVGTCGASANRGDFVGIAERLGAKLANMGEAWWEQLPLEPCLESFEQELLIFQNYGDSMIVVNGSGVRVANEKEPANERCKTHFVRDAAGGYPNRLLIQIFDDAVVQDDTDWPGRWPIPFAGDIPPYVLRGDTLDELTDVISARLAELAGDTEGFALEPDFATTLKATVERFNQFARSGEDEDFQRGATWAQRYFSVEFRDDPMPNFTMYPIADHGPYYAIVLGAACLGTKGGPKIDTRSRVMRPDGTPIPRLYGAGNCIGSPVGEGYWGGGATLGAAIFNGYLAGKNVVDESVREIPTTNEHTRS